MKAHQIGRGTFYVGDALKLLKQLPAESVHCVLTDPPYRITSGGKYNPAKNKHKAGWHNSGLSSNDGSAGIKHNDLEPWQYMAPLYRVLKPGSHCYVMINSRNLEDLLVAAREAGFGFHNLLIWEKNNVIVNRWYSKHTELICMFYKHPAKQINRQGSKQIFKAINLPGKQRVHPTQKPIKLLRHYISNSTKRGEIVLDPFAGSGSTAIAAQKLARRWITCEIDKDHADAAIKNIHASCKAMARRAQKHYPSNAI